MGEIKKVLVSYYSGTGGVKKAANVLSESLIERNCEVIMHSMDISKFNNYKDQYQNIVKEVDLIIVLYAVYAFGAPRPVDRWVENLPKTNNLPVVVISVSGGGEIWPNTSCRVATIRGIEKKGYEVLYEKMMVMPANMLCKVNDDMAMHLINSIPMNINKILDEVFSGKRHRSRFKISTRVLMPITNIEKNAVRNFSKDLVANDACTGCVWCALNCPMGNIELKDDKPIFKDDCIMCLRCYYGCPNKAIHNEKVKGLLFKEGFDLNAVEKRMEGKDLKPINECCKGLAWIGVKRYLLGRE
ncbi:EFR1 family ferrodoxin [Clostridium saccharoperbutylacetonicum]